MSLTTFLLAMTLSPTGALLGALTLRLLAWLML